MKRSKQRGVSIAEICVVLAVISIAALMVTSFSLMVNTRSTTAAIRANVLDDAYIAESILDSWFSSALSGGATVSAENGVLSAKKDGITYQVTIQEEMLTAPLPAGQELEMEMSVVTAITVEQKQNAADTIWFCTLHYPDPQDNHTDLTYTFCVNPRIGE
ncbi:MAG: hypothetical protein IKK11_02840 [Oscillospiraceae bacterium]|nr:hypothetical protein [Oscillospiraceae bacterium]